MNDDKTVRLGVWEWVAIGCIMIVLLAHVTSTEQHFRELKQPCVEQTK